MIKFKLFLTVLVLILFATFREVYTLYESPIRGIANAQQLNDSPHDFAWAKFVSSNGITKVAFGVTIVLIAGIWSIGKNKKVE